MDRTGWRLTELFLLAAVLGFVGHRVACVLLGILLAGGRLAFLFLRLGHN
jgi:hypothetical protein